MGPRPAYLNLNNTGNPSDTRAPPKMNFTVDLPSPRTGEVPPALSPLDAFALQSRILARQFEQQKHNGRRVSRLPHEVVTGAIGNRPDYFRSASDGSLVGMGDVPEESSPISPATRQEMTIAPVDDRTRPTSHYPHFSYGGGEVEGDNTSGTPFFDAPETQHAPESNGYFGIGVPRASSPEPVDPKLNVEAPSPLVPSLTNSVDSVTSPLHPRTLTNGSNMSQRSLRSDRGLLPPRSPAFPKSPGLPKSSCFPNSPRSVQSFRSARRDSGDEDGSSYSGPYVPYRKFSGSSNMSRPHSPFSPYMQPVERSPSMTSEFSMNGSQPHPPIRRAQNFSRPRSSGAQSTDVRPSMDSRPSFDNRPSLDSQYVADVPCRHLSTSSRGTRPTYSANASRQNSNDDVRPSHPLDQSQTSNDGEPLSQEVRHSSEQSPAPGSYIYAKYALPRGRGVERSSAEQRTSWIHHQFKWDEGQTTQDQIRIVEEHKPRARENSDASVLSAPVRPRSPAGSVTSNGSAKSFERISGKRLSSRHLPAASSGAIRSRSANPDTRPVKHPLHKATTSMNSESTDRTIRPTTTHSDALTMSEMTPEQHLEIGIQAHTDGALQKSTYHLRLAARQGLPTAMLLYALACRHGWGMRPNQEEGVSWLRKAIDGSSGEVIDVEEAVSTATRTTKPGTPAEAAERKKRKAQFALAIYELGISYMNGWGCSRDKSLAVRCYEVAGNWGDCDALAEAGYCYAQGVGRKKDPKKAAALYRKAAEGGMSMAGNSWIYKPKYMDDATSKSPEKEKRHPPERVNTADLTDASTQQRPSGRARSKSFWGRRK